MVLDGAATAHTPRDSHKGRSLQHLQQAFVDGAVGGRHSPSAVRCRRVAAAGTGVTSRPSSLVRWRVEAPSVAA